MSYVYVDITANRVYQNRNGLQLAEMTAPGTPPTGLGHLYAKSDGKIYWKDDAGVESDLTATGGAGIYQPLDSDLTTISGLTATTNNFIVSVSSAWASRTPAQVKTTLSLDNVDNTSDANKPISTATQTALDLKPNIVGTPVHLTGQTASIGATTFYTTTADGFYTITVQLAVTTTGGTSIGCQIKFTNQADNVVKTMPSNNNNGMNQCASTSLNNAICYTITAYCKTGTNIQYVANVTGAAGVQYSLDAFVIENF